MKKKFYNKEDEKFEDISKQLQKLPQINAPENFEFNLMTRIENKNFGTEKEIKKYTLFSFLKPAIAVVSSVIIVFFVMDQQTNNFENPLISDPQVRNTDSPNQLENSYEKEFILQENAGAVQSNKIKSKPTNLVVVVKDNDVVSEQKGNFPFPDKSFDLDSKLRSSRTGTGNQSRVLAGTNNNRVQFEGFFPGIPTNKRIIDSLRGLDSISQAKKGIPDSLKK